MEKELKNKISQVNALEMQEKINNLRHFPKYQVVEAMYLTYLYLVRRK